MIEGFIKIIEDTDELIREALLNGGALTTPREGQMLINMTGVSISAKPRRDGRYQGYILRDGRKKYLYGKSRQEVAEKMKLYFKEENAPKRKKKEKKKVPTFGEYYAEWLSLYKEPQLKAKSVQSIRDTIKPALARFGDVPLDRITSEDLQGLLISISATRSRDICRATINQIYKKAVKLEIVRKNPCDALEIKKHVYGKRKALTREEEKRFLEAAENSPHYLLFRFLLATGLRIGEALALCVEDFDTKNDTVSVTKDVIFDHGKRIVQEIPKTYAGIRIVPISDELCAAVLDGKDGLVFPTTYNAAKCAIDRISRETGIKVTAHILRHTYATRLEQAKLPPKVRQYLLGHEDGRMTENVYTDVQEEDIKKAADIIRGLF